MMRFLGGTHNPHEATWSDLVIRTTLIKDDLSEEKETLESVSLEYAEALREVEDWDAVMPMSRSRSGASS